MSSSSPQRHWQAPLDFFSSQLFHDVQMARVFRDSKTFADATPNKPLGEVLVAYERAQKTPDFSLAEFVASYFTLPKNVQESSPEALPPTAEQYIVRMWHTLTKPADSGDDYSLIPLPHRYIVPGGRFREIYYWDTFFSALGLTLSGQGDIVEDLIRNFLHIQHQVGCIPNGNRVYYYSRSQPPVLALLNQLVNDSHYALKSAVLKGMENEYAFWMFRQQPDEVGARSHTVTLRNNLVLNRYYDPLPTPRPESYREDLELAEELPAAKRSDFYQHIRAACESGWDFSARWLANSDKLSSVQTCNIVPVDLNCLLYLLEQQLAEHSEEPQAKHFQRAAQKRAAAIQEYCWNAQHGFFVDYHFTEQRQLDVLSIAGTLPLFVGIATAEQAQQVAQHIEQAFLAQGGLVTTLIHSTQQWDAPNGWAPLQWFAVRGLQRYGYTQLANEIMQRWNSMVSAHYIQHGAILEKYNVENPTRTAGGGEYDVQLGFGWTNGVYQDFARMLDNNQ